ncbi:MFS transporter [Frigoribacterium sp. PhB24]|uniref:MFS transporter n=1 Tax=Frigoribacterium sp. PhB24 TaxID=2485204 RepID=UPI000F497B2D|nr:MFS transporter [Frigoribacterium sp. PhB24]ROS48909.1 putative MFS family arabinose efflux permease [Frigoribacterium sp. PhB24]
MTEDVPAANRTPLVGAPADPFSVGAAALEPDSGPPTMPRRLWVLYPLATLSLAVAFGAALQVLLARQVSAFSGGSSDDAGTLGVVVSIAAVFGLVAAPLLGLLSDRARAPFLGRRNFWVLTFAVLGAAGLVVTGLSPSTLVLGIVWAIAIWPLNGYQAMMTAVLPERVPVRVRGTMSGISGFSGLAGTFIGVAVAGLTASPVVAYVAIAVQLVVLGGTFAFFTRDLPSSARSSGRGAGAARLPSFRTQADYWWTFLGRFCTFFGYFMGTGMLLYVLRDFIGVGDGSTTAAAAAIVQVSGTGIVFTMIAALLGGVIADKVGRVKVFVVAASLLFVPGALVPLFVPTFTGLLVGMSIVGFGFGAYLSVDQVLITRVIPDIENAGRDLGIMSVTQGAPQVITPLLGGIVIANLGYPPLFVAMALFSVLGAVSVLFVRRVR